jgi:hypothetical protein
MCGTWLSIASHRPPLLPSPRHDTMVFELSLHRIPWHPMHSPLAPSIVEGGLIVRIQTADHPYSREVSLELTVRVRQQSSRKPAPSGCLALYDTKNRSEQVKLPLLLPRFPHIYPRSCRLSPCMSLQTH